jgi:hypothetical protein
MGELAKRENPWRLFFGSILTIGWTLGDEGRTGEGRTGEEPEVDEGLLSMRSITTGATGEGVGRAREGLA